MLTGLCLGDDDARHIKKGPMMNTIARHEHLPRLNRILENKEQIGMLGALLCRSVSLVSLLFRVESSEWPFDFGARR